MKKAIPLMRILSANTMGMKHVTTQVNRGEGSQPMRKI
jgi:hypothetical protein